MGIYYYDNVRNNNGVLLTEEDVYKMKYKDLIDTKVILEEIYRVKNENIAVGGNSKFNFKMKNIDMLYIKETFAEIINSFKELDEDGINHKKRRELLTIQMKENKKSMIMENLKNGFPHSMRKNLYLFLMGIEPVENNNSNLIEDNILLLDYIILDDIKVGIYL